MPLLPLVGCVCCRAVEVAAPAPAPGAAIMLWET